MQRMIEYYAKNTLKWEREKTKEREKEMKNEKAKKTV